MYNLIDNLVVIGCSSGGPASIDYLMPRLELNRSAALIVPHRDNNLIYQGLQAHGIPAIGVNGKREIRPQEVYVLAYDRSGLLGSCVQLKNEFMEYLNREDWFQAFFKRVDISPFDFLGNGTGPIDRVMSEAAYAYRSRCIGVVLSGAGSDCTLGSRTIKKKGGKVFLQVETRETLEARDAVGTYGNEMPTRVLSAVQADFFGPLEELAAALNAQLRK